MAESLTLGKVGLTTGGTYDASKKYDKLTCVLHDGISWISRREIPIGVVPGTDNEYWQKACERGFQGDMGPAGPQGNSAFDGTGVEIVNNLTQGGESSVLSAEQGKILNKNIEEVNVRTYGRIEEMTPNCFWNLSGIEIGTKWDQSSENSKEGTYCKRITVKEGEVYKIKGSGTKYAERVYAVIDENKLVTRFTTASSVDEELTIRAGEKTLVVNFVSYDPKTSWLIKKEVIFKKEEYSDSVLTGDVSNPIVIATTVANDGFYVQKNGILTSSTNYAVTEAIEVEVGDIIIINGYFTPDLSVCSESYGENVFKPRLSTSIRGEQTLSYVATESEKIAISYNKTYDFKVEVFHSDRYELLNQFFRKDGHKKWLLEREVINCCYSALSMPQNTEAHFRHAISRGFNGLKADMRLTSDGKIVLNHDAGVTLDSEGRITSYEASNSTPIHDMTYAEYMELEFAKTVDDQYVKTCDLSTFLYLCKRYGKTPYLTIRNEYVEFTVAEMYKLLKHYSLCSSAIVNLYPANDEIISALKATDDRLMICNTTNDELSENMIRQTIRYKADILCLFRDNNTEINQALVSLAKEAGIHIWMWNVKTEEDFEDCIKNGITGFQAYSFDIAQ